MKRNSTATSSGPGQLAFPQSLVPGRVIVLSAIRAFLFRAVFGVGVLATVLFLTGLGLDVASFDRSKGGYESPYTGYTGAPTDWSLADRTATGMARRGYVTTMLVDCTTGMISIEIFKQDIEFRVFSPRAIAVHKPREACRDLGFEPKF